MSSATSKHTAATLPIVAAANFNPFGRVQSIRCKTPENVGGSGDDDDDDELFTPKGSPFKEPQEVIEAEIRGTGDKEHATDAKSDTSPLKPLSEPPRAVNTPKDTPRAKPTKVINHTSPSLQASPSARRVESPSTKASRAVKPLPEKSRKPPTPTGSKAQKSKTAKLPTRKKPLPAISTAESPKVAEKSLPDASTSQPGPSKQTTVPSKGKKRKAGADVPRPSAAVEPVAQASVSGPASEAQVPAPKRPRGRPPKPKPVAPQVTPQARTVHSDALDLAWQSKYRGKYSWMEKPPT